MRSTSFPKGFLCIFCLFLFIKGEAQRVEAARVQKEGRCDVKGHKRITLLVQTPVPDSIEAHAVRMGWQVTDRYTPSGLLVIAGEEAALCAWVQTDTRVRYAERGAAPMREEALVPGHNLFVNRFNGLERAFPGIDGRGIHVSVKEENFDSTDIDLLNRTGPSPGAFPLVSDHATQMATLIGGSGTSSARARGGAKGAYLHASGFFSFLPDSPDRYNALDIAVQNHSYGTAVENRYNLSAMAYDQSVRLRPELLHIFSAGNAGEMQAAPGPYAALSGVANLTGNFKTAKNTLVVGAVDSTAQVWPYSSRGPTADGRIKPDLVAFGRNGTSESAALVSAAAVLLRQQLALHAAQPPPAALVRALLINGATDAGLPGPDFQYGFGNLHVYNSMSMVTARQYGQQCVTEGRPYTLTFEVPEHCALLKMTVAWDDPSALPDAGHLLSNDLDAGLIDPTGRRYVPWVKPHQLDSLHIPARPGADTLHTLEQIEVAFPRPGTWTLEVQPTRLNTLEQCFVWAFSVDTTLHFRWGFPRHSDVAGRKRDALLYWSAPGQTAEKGILWWKPVAETTWQKVKDSLPLAPGFIRWRIPDYTGAAQLRMETVGHLEVSDTFLIEPPLRLQVGFVCADSVYMHWAPTAPPGVQYTVYGLGDRYMEPLFNTADTFVVLNTQLYLSARFSIQHRFSNTLRGLPAPAPDIRLQGVGCYVSGFYGTVLEKEIALEGRLETTYRIDSVFFQKQDDRSGGFFTLRSFGPTYTLRTTDPQPLRGVNRYRMALKTNEGHCVYSDTISLLHTGPSLEDLLFPNPFPAAGGDLYRIARQTTEGTERLFLFDGLSRLVFESSLQADTRLPAFSIPALPPGCYFYSVRRERQTLSTGVLVVHP